MNIAISLTTMILGASYLLGVLGYPVIQIVPWSIIALHLSALLLVFSVFQIKNRGFFQLGLIFLLSTMQVKPSLYYLQNAGVVSLLIDQVSVPISPWFALPHLALFGMTMTQIFRLMKNLRRNKLR